MSMQRRLHEVSNVKRMMIAAAALAGFFVTLSLSSVARADERDRPAAEPTDRGDDDTDPLRIGAIAGVGFPRPLAIEALVKIEGVVALGLEYSLLPKTTLGGVETRFWALAADARVFPFKNGF